MPVASGGVVHGAARVTYPTSTLDERVRHYWLLLAAVAAVALGLAAALGVWLARWASRPLVRLESAAVVAAGGDPDARAPVEGPPEIRSVAVAFNEMVARLDGLVTTQRAFVADASHQLRTPLTALRLRLENLERDVGPAGKADLEAAVAEVGRLSGLVDGLGCARPRRCGRGACGAVGACPARLGSRRRMEGAGRGTPDRPRAHDAAGAGHPGSPRAGGADPRQPRFERPRPRRHEGRGLARRGRRAPPSR